MLENQTKTTTFEMQTQSPEGLKKEDWMQKKWRPMMGWVYMITCTTDFILFPIMWAAFQAFLGNPVTAWEPLTLKGAGLYHVAMGAVLGLTAFGRTQEKLQASSGATMPMTSSVPRPLAKQDTPAL